MKIQELTKYNVQKNLISIFEKEGITDLFPPQIDAIKEDILIKDNFLITIPTASGKTLIAEMAMLAEIEKTQKKALYIVPLRALASEKYREFKKYENLGYKVGRSTGDLDSTDYWLKNYDIIIATSEKVDSLIRHQTPWISDLSIVVIDECHLINDESRGPTLEINIVKLKQLNPNIRLIALSATIGNSKYLAKWLNSKLITSTWRPVELIESVYDYENIYYESGEIKEASAKDLIDLAIEPIKDGGQTLIFLNSRRSTQAQARKISKKLKDELSKEELTKLKEISQKLINREETTKTAKQLAEFISKGVAFHHAGLTYSQRTLIENKFRDGLIKIITATPTLAAGINLPARRVIVRDYKRFNPNFGAYPIPILEVKQMLGRAGRPKYDKFGDSFIVTKYPNEAYQVLDRYIRGDPEDISSKLASEPILRMQILGLISSYFVKDESEILSFLEKTFFGYQFGIEAVENIVEQVLKFLEKEELIKIKSKELKTTRFGKKVSQLYIDPLSAAIFKKAITKPILGDPTLGLLHLISKTPDMPKLYLRTNDREEYDVLAEKIYDKLIIKPPNPFENPYEYEYFLSELKMMDIIRWWIDERTEDAITSRFKIGQGDLRNYVESANWLLYAFYEISKILDLKNISKNIFNLRTRVRYGIKRELSHLVKLKGIGRVRARKIYNLGYKTLNSVKKADLTKIRGIGKELSDKIQAQLKEISS